MEKTWQGPYKTWQGPTNRALRVPLGPISKLGTASAVYAAPRVQCARPPPLASPLPRCPHRCRARQAYRDAFNLFDPFWLDPEYDLWYKLLNCGISLPASTGTDWFVCSNNRVYVHTEKEFSYESWIDGMKKGRTFITNGPVIDMTVNDAPIGATLPMDGGGILEAEATFQSHYPVDAVEIIVDGRVVHRETAAGGGFDSGDAFSGSVRCQAVAERDGWVAARLWGHSRDSFNQSLYAHTSPTWFSCGRPSGNRPDSARFFLDSIDESLKWIDTVGRYNSDQQRSEVKELFRRGREVFAQSPAVAWIISSISSNSNEGFLIVRTIVRI